MIEATGWGNSMITSLDEEGVSPRVPLTEDLEAQLHKIFGKDDVEALKALLVDKKSPLSVDSVIGIGRVPLLSFTASFVKRSKLAIAEELLNRGCDIEQRNHLDQTPICYAANRGKADLVALFLKHRPELNPNALDREGCSALLSACRQAGSRYDEVIDLLLACPQTTVDPHPVQDPIVMSILLGERARVSMLIQHESADLKTLRRLQAFIPKDEKIPRALLSINEKPPAIEGDLFKFENKSLAEIARICGQELIAEDIEARVVSIKASPNNFSRSRAQSPNSSNNSFFSKSSEKSIREEGLSNLLLEPHLRKNNNSPRSGSSRSS